MKGFTALPIVIIFGLVALGIVVAGLFVVQLVNRSNFGIQLAAEVRAAARSVLAQTQLSIIRGDLSPLPILCNDLNPAFTSYASAQLGRVTVTPNVCRYNCSLVTCRYRVRADAQSSFFIKRQVEALFDEDIETGEIKLINVKTLIF